MNKDLAKYIEKAKGKSVAIHINMFVDIAGDIVSGLLLSQIVYWQDKLKLKHDGKKWLAKQRMDWWEEVRISPRQYDRAIKKLEDKKLVEVKNSMFANKRTPFIWLNQEELVRQIRIQLGEELEELRPYTKDNTEEKEKGKSAQSYIKCNTGINKSVIPVIRNQAHPYTETTQRLQQENILYKENDKKDLFLFYGENDLLDDFINYCKEFSEKEHFKISEKEADGIIKYLISAEQFNGDAGRIWADIYWGMANKPNLFEGIKKLDNELRMIEYRKKNPLRL